MSAKAYYNDNDKFVCEWLRGLIKAGLIAPGEVDERSIEEVKPEDLRGFTQCHFFAGIAVWSYALRNAGWPDDRPVWTGSCPCPPFSSVGLKKACPQCEGTNPVPHVGRTGVFVCCLCDHEWLADSRHLWPELWRLIAVGRPDAFFGEQVASDDGRTWLASVRASLEILGYAVGAADLCSAGVGSADIRQRLFFAAEPDSRRRQESEISIRQPRQVEAETIKRRGIDGMADSGSVSGVSGVLEHSANVGHTQRTSEASAEQTGAPSRTPQQRLSEVGIMGQPESNGRIGWQDNRDEGRRECVSGQAGETDELGDACGTGLPERERDGRVQREALGAQSREAAERGGDAGELAHTDSVESSNGEIQRSRRLLQPSENPLTGFWRDAEWLYCRDEKWRPVEPGSFPLVTGTPNRVGRLRGYGNAINAEVAKAFIEAYMSI